MLVICPILYVTLFLDSFASGIHYKPTWDSLDERQLPQWYDEAKFGIFIHWGVFSVPSYEGPWFWERWKGPESQRWDDIVKFMKKNYPPNFTYADFAADFTAELYDPAHWAEMLNASGARYVVLVAKHHEGFCNWPSKYSWNWNSIAVGPKRDLVGDLASAVRKYNLKFGTYHSLFEFFNPLFLLDQENNFTTNDFVARKTMPELYELVNNYKPDIIWSDGHWLASSTYWNSTNFLAWLYNDSPVKDIVVTNDRWGNDSDCKHGGFFTCGDSFNPGTLQSHKFEDATTIDRAVGHWSYRRNMKVDDIFTSEQLIGELVQVVSCGGNLLLNVGPTKEGTIVPIFEERLRQIGSWLEVNGEAIYATRPWIYQNDTEQADVWYTSKETETGVSVYAIVLNLPATPTLFLSSPQPVPQTTVALLGYPQPVTWSNGELGGLVINIPTMYYGEMKSGQWAFKLDNLGNYQSS